jgi:hypothetical protein
MKKTSISLRWMAGLLTAALFAVPTTIVAQETGIAGSSVLLAGDIARLELELMSGQTTVLELNTGHVLVDGVDLGSYEQGGAFENSWRDLLRNPAIESMDGLGALLTSWEPAAGGQDGTARTAILGAFDRFDPASLAAVDAPAVAEAKDGVTIVPGSGSIGQLAERLEHLSGTLDRIVGNHIQFDDDFALVVNSDYHIADGMTIDGNVALLEGDLLVDGDINGDVLVLGGELDLEPGATVFGDIHSIGGEVETTGATVMGEILALSGISESIDQAVGDLQVGVNVDAPIRISNRYNRGGRGFFGNIAHNFGHAVGGVFGTALWILGLSLFGVLLVYFTPNRLETVAGMARTDLLRSFGVGLAGQILFGPVLVLLALLIVTWLVIPFYVVAAAVALPLGYVAVARATGEAMVDRRYPLLDRFNLNRSNTYYYVFNGLLLLLAPFAIASALHVLGDWLGFLRGLIAFVGVVLTWAAATTGLGAVILTRGGSTGPFKGFRRSPKDFFEDLNLDSPEAPATGGETDA